MSIFGVYIITTGSVHLKIIVLTFRQADTISWYQMCTLFWILLHNDLHKEQAETFYYQKPVFRIKNMINLLYTVAAFWKLFSVNYKVQLVNSLHRVVFLALKYLMLF